MRLAFPTAIGFAALLLASCSNSPSESPASHTPPDQAVATHHDDGSKQSAQPQHHGPAHGQRPAGHHSAPQEKNAGHHKDHHDGHGQPPAAGNKAAHDHAAHSSNSPKKESHAAGQHPATKKAAAPAPRTRDWDWQLDRRVAEENNWIWTGSDLSDGFKQAAATGKPLMVVVRCPP